MPAMKPSTTTRARTSRWASRATMAGSSTSRAPRRSLRRAALGAGWPESETLMASSRLPREAQHLSGVGLEGPPVPSAQDVPAVVLGEPEQQLELVAVNPALARLEAMGARDGARGVQLLDVDQRMLDLPDAIFRARVPHPHHAPGRGIARLGLQHARGATARGTARLVEPEPEIVRESLQREIVELGSVVGRRQSGAHVSPGAPGRPSRRCPS